MAPLGTGALILVALQLVGVAVTPLNLTVLLPWVDPKFAPVMVTDVAIVPEVGDRLVTLGVPATVKLTPLLAVPPTVTTTLPVAAPLGTVAVMLVVLQLVAVAVVPLNLTVLVPWVDPKPLPLIVMEAPIAPEFGDKVVMLTMVKFTPLLATLPTVTTTLPVVAPLGTVAFMLVALHEVTLAVVPLNLTVLVPWLEPNPLPVIITDVPTVPEVGDNDVIEGAAKAANEKRSVNRTNTTRLRAMQPPRCC